MALDQGRHRLKVFQRSNGLDGEGEPRTVLVRPPAGAIAVHSPADGEVIDPKVTVSGSGPSRQGIRGGVSVYQVASGRERLPRDGRADRFGRRCAGGRGAAPRRRRRLPGADHGQGVGRQCLAVSNTQSSLSGAGSAESDLSSVFTVRVRPGTPTITKPARTGTLQLDSLTVAVAGTALARSTVTIYAERVAGAAVVQTAPAAGGTFAATLALPAAGTYRLTATATIDGAESAHSDPPVVIAVGDVIPPTVKVANPADPAKKPVRDIPVTAASDSGADFNVGPWVTAVESVVERRCARLDRRRPDRLPARGQRDHALPARRHRGHLHRDRQRRQQGVDDLPGRRPVGLRAGAGRQQPDGRGAVAVGRAGQLPDHRHRLHRGLRDARFGISAELLGMAAGVDRSDRGRRQRGMDRMTRRCLRQRERQRREPALQVDDRRSDVARAAAPPASTGAISQIIVQSGSPPTITVVPAVDPGLRISRDGGQSWITLLAGIRIRSVAQDPRDGGHLLAANLKGSGTPSQLYETRDAGATWTPSGGGLPDEQIARWSSIP